MRSLRPIFCALLLVLCGGFLLRGGGTIVSSSGAVTTVTLQDLGSGTSSGQAFRFGLPVGRTVCPTGQVLDLVDSGSHTLTYQADARVAWPDGSLEYAEVLAYTGESIAANGTDAIAVKCITGTWNNAPGLTNYGLPASIATIESNIEAFSGAQNLNVQLSSVAQDSRLPTTATNVGSGTWEIIRNDIINNTGTAQNAHCYVTNAGPVALGRWCWADFVDASTTTQAHESFRIDWYEWAWVTNTGAIKDFQYAPAVFNGPMVSSGTTRIDRFNYNWAIQNGATVIASGSTPHGSPQTDILNITTTGGGSGTGTFTTIENHDLNTGDYVWFNGATGNNQNSTTITNNVEGPATCQVTVINATEFTCPYPSNAPGGGTTLAAVPSTTLTSSIGTGTGTIGVTSTTDLPSSGTAVIADGSNLEYVTYSVVDATDVSLTVRGLPGSHGYAFTSTTPQWNQTGATSHANGATFSVGGTVIGFGGELARSEQFFLRADAKPRWIGSSTEADVEAVRATTSAIHDATSSGVIPPLNWTTSVSNPSITGYSYQPFYMGDWSVDGDWTTEGVGANQIYYGIADVDSAGETTWIGQIDEINARCLYNYHWCLEGRIDNFTFEDHPWRFVDDATGLSPNILNSSVSGLTSWGPTAYYNSESYIYTGARTAGYSGFQTFSEPSNDIPGVVVGATNGGVSYYRIGSHWPQMAYMRYVFDGFRYNLNLIDRNADTVESWIAPSTCSASCGNDDRDFTYSSTHYYGMELSVTAEFPRQSAHTMDAIRIAAQLSPPVLADGSTNPERAYFADILQQNLNWAVAWIANAPSYWRTEGAWNVPATGNGNYLVGLGDPWMYAGYFGTMNAGLYNAFYDDATLGTNVTTFTAQVGTGFTYAYNQGFCNWEWGDYEIVGTSNTTAVDSTNVNQVLAPYNWQWWDTDVNNPDLQRGPLVGVTSDGWLTMVTNQGDSGYTINFTNPTVGDPMTIGAIYLTDSTLQVPPNGFTSNQTYYIAATDPTNYRIQLATSQGSTTPVTPSPTVYVSSGTYNSATGAVSLTLTNSPNIASGTQFTLSGLTGSGAVSSLDGLWTATSGTTGTTLNFTGTTGLGSITFSGGDFGWVDYLYNVGSREDCPPGLATMDAGTSPIGYGTKATTGILAMYAAKISTVSAALYNDIIARWASAGVVCSSWVHYCMQAQ